MSVPEHGGAFDKGLANLEIVGWGGGYREPPGSPPVIGRQVTSPPPTKQKPIA